MALVERLHGFLLTTTTRQLKMAKDAPAHDLLLAEEYYSAEDSRFISALRKVTDSNRLAQFADRWKHDQRIWSRTQKVEYLRGEPNCVGHQPVVKRLFKQAEEDSDHTVVAACAALFDRLVRHVKRTRYRYHWPSRTSWTEDYLATTSPKLPYGSRPRKARNPFTGEPIDVPPPPAPKDAIYFSYRTRYYLQRRAWRYFRRLAVRAPQQYVDAAVLLLREYRDADFERGERILDCWTLLQLAFREHPALRFGRERIRLAEGGSLGQLTAAPRFRKLWQTTAAFDQLIELMDNALSRLVRVWAMQLLAQDHSERIASLPAAKLLALLTSEDEDIRQFAARCLKDSPHLSGIPLESWLELLDQAPPTALPAVCEVIESNVSAERLSLQQCVELALREPTSIAQLGLHWLRAKSIKSEDDYELVARLADVQCVAIAGEAADWALGLVGSKAEYDRDHVSRFFDSLSPGVRRRTWAWLESDECPGADDPVLFCRLLETPFDDLRLRVVDLLERRNLPGEARPGLVPVWTSVLLGVHRGGRQKLKATRQLADELIRHPERANDLLPVLAAAVRSVRQPEARAGVAAIVSSLTTNPQLAEAVARNLPELEIIPAESPA